MNVLNFSGFQVRKAKGDAGGMGSPVRKLFCRGLDEDGRSLDFRVQTVGIRRVKSVN